VEEQGAATQEISRNVQQAARGTQQVSSNITDVQRGAGETGSASSQVLSSAQSLSSDSNRLKPRGQQIPQLGARGLRAQPAQSPVGASAATVEEQGRPRRRSPAKQAARAQQPSHARHEVGRSPESMRAA